MIHFVRSAYSAARRWPHSIATRFRAPSCREKATGTGAFSSIELMAAMAVITILAGMVVPAVKGVTGGNSVDASAVKLSGLLTLARSEAIAQHTIVRFVVATDWRGKAAEANLRRVSLWSWHAESGGFLQLTNWEELPAGIIMERELPAYVRTAKYATDDASTVRGGSVLGADFATKGEFATGTGAEGITGRFIEFLPSGSARLPGNAERRAIFVATQGFAEAGQPITYTAQANGQPTNWAQVNVDTLTGRAHVYRP